jgi:hypothetical protein
MRYKTDGEDLMAKSSELFQALLETLRPLMSAGISHDRCLSTVRDHLADENALLTAHFLGNW